LAAHGLSAAACSRGTTQLLPLAPPPAAQGLQGLQGLAAAQGLHGFFAAQGLHGFFAAHGFLAAHGLQGLHAAYAGPTAGCTPVAMPTAATPTSTAKGMTVLDSKWFLYDIFNASRGFAY
jgi:hypothetical protein